MQRAHPLLERIYDVPEFRELIVCAGRMKFSTRTSGGAREIVSSSSISCSDHIARIMYNIALDKMDVLIRDILVIAYTIQLLFIESSCTLPHEYRLICKNYSLKYSLEFTNVISKFLLIRYLFYIFGYLSCILKNYFM